MIAYLRKTWYYRPGGPKSALPGKHISFRHWLWWMDNWFFHHHLRPICWWDLHKHGYTWKEAIYFFRSL